MSDLIDYFPSFEIINSVSTRGIFYENNLRSINAKGVETVMGYFLANNVVAEERAGVESAKIRKRARIRKAAKGGDSAVQCDEALLEGFQ
jgi:hypothetical protein